MEIKLNIYADRMCRKIDRVVTAKDFELSVGVCEDVLKVVNIDMFSGGLQALTEESQKELMIEMIKDGYPVFIELVKEVFELSDDDAKHVKVSDIASVIFDIVKYSMVQLAGALGGKAEKN